MAIDGEEVFYIYIYANSNFYVWFENCVVEPETPKPWLTLRMGRFCV